MREKILTFIEKNSRIDTQELAVILGVDETAVMNELEAMEQEGIICGYHTLINWDKAGVEKVTALIEVRVTPQRGMGFDKVAERIYNYPEVNSVYLISGGFDLMVTLEGKTLREISQFVSDKLSALDQVLSTKTNFILKKYKDHGTVMAPKAKECGIDVCVNTLHKDFGEAMVEAFGPDKADVIYDCAGNNITMGQAIKYARKGSVIVLVAVFAGMAEVDLAVANDHELDIKSTMMYRHDDYVDGIRLVNEGKVHLKPLISKTFAFKDYLKAYQYIDDNRETTMKVIINVQED